MIVDARDRVLHHALKLVHQDQPPVDLTAEIVAAWERGVRGSGIPEEGPDEELLEERELVRAASRTLSLPTWLVAASIVAAGGLAVWTIGTRGRATEGDEVAVRPAETPDPVPGATSTSGGEPGGPAVPALVTDEDRAALGEAFEAATGATYDWRRGFPIAAGPGEEGPVDELARLLGGKPALWGELEARVLALVEASPEPPAALGGVMDLIAFDPSEAAMDLARTVWMVAPEVFTEYHVVTLAERGAFEFEREVAERVALYTPDAPEEPLLSATYLALRGDEDAALFLLDHFPEELPVKAEQEIQKVLAAAVALDLRRHPEPWSRVKRSVIGEVEGMLERGDLVRARMLALGLEFFALARAEGKVMELGALPVRILSHHAERVDELQDPEDIRALLAAM